MRSNNFKVFGVLRKIPVLQYIRRLLQAFGYYFYNHCVSNVPSYILRHLYLRICFGIKLGRKSAIHMGCFVTGCNISIGHHSVINRRCYLDGRIGIEIGNNVGISPEVYIISLTHDPDDKQFHTAGAKVVIEDRVWIGARAMLMPGVKLSEGCVVGAGSVVTKSFAPYSIVAGVPAKFIRERKRNDSYELNYFPLFDTDITL